MSSNGIEDGELLGEPPDDFRSRVSSPGIYDYPTGPFLQTPVVKIPSSPCSTASYVFFCSICDELDNGEKLSSEERFCENAIENYIEILQVASATDVLFPVPVLMEASFRFL